MRIFCVIVGLILLNVSICLAQIGRTSPNSKKMDKHYGIHLQLNDFKNPSLELGYGRWNFASSFRGCGFPPSFGWNIGSGFNFDQSAKVIYPKVGVWVSGIYSMGLSMLYVGDVNQFEKGSLRIRPEIGFGGRNVRLIAQWNIPVYHYAETQKYMSVFSLGLMIDLGFYKK